MTVNDCVKISHAISPQLDHSDPVAGRYTLEVTSPGLDRPLVGVKDFERYTGHVARIELAKPLDGKGQKRFQGNIVRVTGNAPDAEIEIRTEAGGVRIPANTIAKARLVLTDAPPNAKTDTKH
jgi:ribosome maturation factor RimP